ncbi:MAG: bifunctional demethylmenaquinone methyltransferase/2-methoxy-6-polyprenyl-1,4-benzoquinol methylase UbiE [Deltaproteobacteria bacterium]|nr:bifunctional demethylmenaquinone methyltransferase/2-methoxy-6-polyprenyl-1,4-benzoquinol methylase UbiE [Deltaproteobacteria bacterium]
METALEKNPRNEPNHARRIRAVRRMFTDISPRYDLLNRIMSARQDVRWRRFAVARVPAEASRVLDVATGTGDLAIDLASARPDVTVFGVDFTEPMLRRAEAKTAERGLSRRISYAIGDALRLPFADREFDAVTVAFGIRNMPDRRSALAEMMRVVKPGGKVITLEMTFPKNLKLRRFFVWYLNRVIPALGGIISGNPQAYRYLPDSIQDFLHPDDLTELCHSLGLKRVQAFPLMFGLTYVHEGLVP